MFKLISEMACCSSACSLQGLLLAFPTQKIGSIIPVNASHVCSYTDYPLTLADGFYPLVKIILVPSTLVSLQTTSRLW